MAAALVVLAAPAPTSASDLVITGVVDGPLSGGLPKAIELCVVNDVADLSIYGVGSANNGGGSDGEEFTFPAVGASAGTFLYVASEAGGFSSFFGFAPTYTDSAAEINGDDAIELFMSGGVVDIFGDIDTDGTGHPWEYLDGWAYRDDGTGPDGSTFVIANWSFSGPYALDGESNNDTATTPFPIGAYSACELPEPPPDLLLSEVVVTPTAGEFVELHNPTAATVDLSDVYLTDATFAGSSTFYYKIVTGADAGGGGFGDFHARFPDGATIAPGEFQTISMTGSDDFFATYGLDPTYELFEDGSPDAVPDMREALPGSINNQGGLTNGGEIVILYTWDGASDLVQDIDYALWGDKDEAVDKTGVSIDGPDGDAVASTYLDDTPIAVQDVVFNSAHSSGDSFQRVDFSEGTEVQTGGNGLTGSDETSENLSITWGMEAATPGAPPSADWVINEIHADPASDLAGDANGDGVRDSGDDEFVEIVNVSGAAVDISGWTLSDGAALRHTFPTDTVIPDGCGVVVFGGGTPNGSFGKMAVQTASTGSLGLNNSGDQIYFNNGSGDIATADYGSEGGDNQSLTLDPDVTGALPYIKHSVATGSGGALFSPGTRIDGSGFGGCPQPWVINEIHADPASGDAGDANGDGIQNFSDDEFVEIVNDSGADVDLSGWTLSDAFTVRHVFPENSVVLKGCSVVVFGGPAATGTFGNSLVQTASSGALGFNNGGDTVTLNDGVVDRAAGVYGGEGGDNQSLTLDPDVTGLLPYVKHSVATGSGGALFSPGTKIDGSQFDGCPVAAEIWEIQGAGASSPLESKLVWTDADVVTAVATDGFFMQSPVGDSDGDPDTSDGVFVFTGGAPGVGEGDLVDVEGTVVEFFGFTEIGGSPSVVKVGDGTLPLPVQFNSAVPSPDPLFPSCAIEYECYEGMLVDIPLGTVSGPNQVFGSDPIAEVHIVAGPQRAYREPGVLFPGLGLPPIPTWDGNPELFELDPDKLGLPNLVIPAGSSFTATGVLGYEFGGYELWPTSLSVVEATLPYAVRPRGPGEFTVGTLNLFRLFDDIDDPADDDGRNDQVIDPLEYALRLAKFGTYIVDVLDAPDILAVQEVESLKVLGDLAAAVALVDGSVTYSAHLVEGNDIGTIDVGFLTRDKILVDAITQLGKDEMFLNPETQEMNILHDRPPLLLEGWCQLEYGVFPIAAMVVHNRSLNGIEDGPRVRQKRQLQAESIAVKVQDMQIADTDVRLVVLGDFNAFEFTDGYADAINVIRGDFDPAMNLVCSDAGMSCADLVDPNLTNEVMGLPATDRYSYIFRGNAQVLDHALTTVGLADEMTGADYGRGNADAFQTLIEEETVLRASDHDGLVVYILNDEDNDGVPNDDDVCPGTAIPEEVVPSVRLGRNRFALVDGDGEFDTNSPPTPPMPIDSAGAQSLTPDSESSSFSSRAPGPEKEFDIGDTAGCSCEQIIEIQGLGEGHVKFGCSISAMEDWIDLVNPE